MRTLWDRAREARSFAWIWLFGHTSHWRSRNRFLNDEGKIVLLQRCLAVLSLIVGGIMSVTRAGDCGSLLVRTMDTICRSGFALALHQQPSWQPWVRPHQVFGLALIASSVALLVAVYEWPDAVDHAQEADAQVADSRLIRLLRMHLFGHKVALNYWAATGLLSAFAHPLTLGPWVALYIAYNHHWLYLRNNAEYEREKDAALCARDARSRTERGREALKSALRDAERGGVEKRSGEALSACH